MYSESNDVLLANSSVVALHSAYSGTKTIKIPGTYRVRDVVSGQLFDASTDSISFELDAPETRVFLLENVSDPQLHVRQDRFEELKAAGASGEVRGIVAWTGASCTGHALARAV